MAKQNFISSYTKNFILRGYVLERQTILSKLMLATPTSDYPYQMKKVLKFVDICLDDLDNSDSFISEGVATDKNGEQLILDTVHMITAAATLYCLELGIRYVMLDLDITEEERKRAVGSDYEHISIIN